MESAGGIVESPARPAPGPRLPEPGASLHLLCCYESQKRTHNLAPAQARSCRAGLALTVCRGPRLQALLPPPASFWLHCLESRVSSLVIIPWQRARRRPDTPDSDPYQTHTRDGPALTLRPVPIIGPAPEPTPHPYLPHAYRYSYIYTGPR